MNIEKRNHYIKESLKLFMTYGVKRVTVGQLTQHLNISSKTLYAQFGDKTGLVYACFELYKDNSSQAFERMEEASENVADLLIQFYNQLVEDLGRISPNFYNDIAQYFPEIWDSQEAFGIHHTRNMLMRGIKEGLFVEGLDLDICAETLTMLLRSMLERDPLTRPGTQRLMTNVLWPYVRGICTADGLEQFRAYRRFAVMI
ncbi:MAG: TetR/AcrR family transcriptional regulator [Bacteroidota bacterium]